MRTLLLRAIGGSSYAEEASLLDEWFEFFHGQVNTDAAEQQSRMLIGAILDHRGEFAMQ